MANETLKHWRVCVPGGRIETLIVHSFKSSFREGCCLKCEQTDDNDEVRDEAWIVLPREEAVEVAQFILSIAAGLEGPGSVSNDETSEDLAAENLRLERSLAEQEEETEAAERRAQAAEARCKELCAERAEARTHIREKVEPLITALGDEKYLARGVAAETLGWIGPAAEKAVPALIEALSDERRWVRVIVAEALGRIGPVAEAAVEALIKAQGDESALVRVRAAKALLSLTADDDDEQVRKAAAKALAEIAVRNSD